MRNSFSTSKREWNRRKKVLEGDKKKGIFVLIGSFFMFFKGWVSFANIGVILTLLTDTPFL